MEIGGTAARIRVGSWIWLFFLPHTSAFVWRNTIHFRVVPAWDRNPVVSARLLAHEWAHVLQWRSMGWWTFLVRWTMQVALGTILSFVRPVLRGGSLLQRMRLTLQQFPLIATHVMHGYRNAQFELDADAYSERNWQHFLDKADYFQA